MNILAPDVQVGTLHSHHKADVSKDRTITSVEQFFTPLSIHKVVRAMVSQNVTVEDGLIIFRDSNGYPVLKLIKDGLVEKELNSRPTSQSKWKSFLTERTAQVFKGLLKLAEQSNTPFQIDIYETLDMLGLARQKKNRKKVIHELVKLRQLTVEIHDAIPVSRREAKNGQVSKHVTVGGPLISCHSTESNEKPVIDIASLDAVEFQLNPDLFEKYDSYYTYSYEQELRIRTRRHPYAVALMDSFNWMWRKKMGHLFEAPLKDILEESGLLNRVTGSAKNQARNIRQIRLAIEHLQELGLVKVARIVRKGISALKDTWQIEPPDNHGSKGLNNERGKKREPG